MLLLKDEGGAHPLTPLVVPEADDRALLYIRVSSQDLLDLERRNLVSAALDNIDRLPAENPVRAVPAPFGEIAGFEPSSIYKSPSRGFGVVPILQEDVLSPYYNLSGPFSLDHAPALIDYPHTAPGKGHPRAARLSPPTEGA